MLRDVMGQETLFYARTDDDDDDDDEAKQAAQITIEKCERFLRKYGQKPWSNQFGRVVLAYMELLNRCVHHEEK